MNHVEHEAVGVATAAFYAFLAFMGAGLASPSLAAQEAEKPARPRIVVALVIDQMPTWLYEQGRPWFGEGGFRRLERDGVAFARTAYRHACTLTGPGHATLSTGAVAADHGIVGNTWLNRDTKKTVYCCDDPEAAIVRAPEPGTEGTAPPKPGHGRSPRALLAPTFGDTLKLHLGSEAKVVTLSWKDRSAIMLGGRLADLAAWIDDTTGRFVSSSFYGAALPPWLIAFDAKRPMDAAFGRSWERAAQPPAYAGLVDERALEAPSPRGARILPRVIDGGLAAVGTAYYWQLAGSPFASEVLVDAALAALTGAGLGDDAVPDFLGLSFSANDLVGHACGPDSVEARDMLLRTDALVTRLLEALDERVGRDGYAFIVSSDHGAPPLVEARNAGRGVGGRGPITRQAAQAANRALIEAFGAPPEGTERWIAGTDESSLYLERAALASRKIDAAQACEIAARAAAGVPGMQLAATLEQVSARAGREPVYRALAAMVVPSRVGDVLIVNAPYWHDSQIPSTHGTPWPYDQEVPLLVMGPGLRKGFRCHDAVTPGAGVVVAARLLGLPKPALAWDEAPGAIFE